jgi:hypothetical protein
MLFIQAINIMIEKKAKFIFCCSFLICLFLPHVLAQQCMQIKQKDGTVIQILLSDITKLTFSDFNTATPEQKAKIMPAIMKLKAYPNPASDYIKIDYELILPGNAIVAIYSISGLFIYSSSLGNQGTGKHTYQWSVNSLKSGIYVFKFIQNDKIVNEKVIVNK